MIKTGKTGYLFAAALIGFFVGYVHHNWFFPLIFDGDAAAMHVLAKVILDEKSLLPLDFNYGNQLIFFRSSPFIALASFFGFTGYKAFVFGSSLSIAFWAVILYSFLSVYFDSAKKGLLFSGLLLIPLGPWDAGYVLGQQSHLSGAILALGIVVSMHQYILDKKKVFLVIGCLVLFLVSVEAPIRGLLVLAPMLVAIILTSNLRMFFVVTLLASISFMLAYVTNQILIDSHPIATNHFNTITFKSSNAFFANLTKITGKTIGSVSSLNAVSDKKLSFLNFIVYASGIIFVIANLVFVFAGMTRAAGLGLRKLSHPHKGHSFLDEGLYRFVALTAVLGVIIGAFAVSGLNPNSARHYLWAIFLVKLCLFAAMYDVASRSMTKKGAVAFVVATSLVLSSWFASLAVHGMDKLIKTGNYPEAVHTIERIADETGIRYIYGVDFWRMMPLNTLLHNVNAQTLHPDGNIVSWLTRPSWACVEGDVLYYLKDRPDDKAIEEKLENIDGTKVHDGNGYTIWVGSPVWQVPPTASCYVYPTNLNFDKKAILSLPSTTGIVENGIRKTNNNSGFLVYGPYSPLKAGSYRFSIYGSSEVVSGSYVEVVSDKGRRVYARLNLKRDAEGVLLRDAAIQLPSDVLDIEVRIWVNERAEFKLFGYSLKPFSVDNSGQNHTLPKKTEVLP